MRFSNLSIFLILFLVASLGLNWYLIQKNEISTIDNIIGYEPDYTITPDDNISLINPIQEQETINKDKTEWLKELQFLFENESYYEAWLLLSRRDIDDVNLLKNNWLKICENWLVKDPNASRIDGFIDAGLKVYPNDIELRQLDAERLLVREKYIAAIDQLYVLYKESNTKSQQSVFYSRIKEISNKRIKRLKKLQDWQALIELTQRLLWHDSNNASLILMHGQALAKLERYSEAKSNLYLITDDNKFGTKATELINKIDQAILNEKLERKAISLKTTGSHHVVRVLIDNYLPVNLMIDTGASITTISESTFNALQQSSSAIFIREQEFNTAGGIVTAPIYRVNSFRVDDFELSNIELAVMDLNTGSVGEGLLGMNFLSNFDFKINQQQHALILAPRN